MTAAIKPQLDLCSDMKPSQAMQLQIWENEGGSTEAGNFIRFELFTPIGPRTPSSTCNLRRDFATHFLFDMTSK